MTTQSNIKPLPKKVFDYVDKNGTLATFGFISLSKLRSCTGTKLPERELKKRINKQFATQFVGNNIQYT